jgi:hypothetical protein
METKAMIDVLIRDAQLFHLAEKIKLPLVTI